jgi:hypothetical protein
MENNIKDYFVAYEQALAVKDLGFDEPCFATGFADDSLFFITPNKLKDERHEPLCVTNDECIWEDDEECINGLKEVLKPTKSQVFRWFREKYGFYHLIHHTGDDYGHLVWKSVINDINVGLVMSYAYPSYEEAENFCIDKLIELAKQQKDGKN